IAEEERGHFLSVDQFFMNCGNLVSLLFTALLITGTADPWEYSLVFSVAAAACIVAMCFIAKTPDAATGPVMQLSETRVPLKEMITYRPFRELVIFNVIYATVIGSFGVFTIEYLHDHSSFDVRSVLALSACAFAGALVVVPLCGRIIDTTSSKRLMLFANGLMAIVISAWILISTNRLPCTHPVAAGLNLASGVATAIFNIANIRMAMAIMPETGRNYFFACFTVITSFGLAGAPIAWGILLDVLASYEFEADPLHWQRHSIYFVALLATEVVAIAWVSRLHEFSPDRTGHVWSRR
ncbi:MAG TPA: MFS transporter, partial [Terrimicrobiaceae bacterium]